MILKLSDHMHPRLLSLPYDCEGSLPPIGSEDAPRNELVMERSNIGQAVNPLIPDMRVQTSASGSLGRVKSGQLVRIDGMRRGPFQ